MWRLIISSLTFSNLAVLTYESLNQDPPDLQAGIFCGILAVTFGVVTARELCDAVQRPRD